MRYSDFRSFIGVYGPVFLFFFLKYGTIFSNIKYPSYQPTPPTITQRCQAYELAHRLPRSLWLHDGGSGCVGPFFECIYGNGNGPNGNGDEPFSDCHTSPIPIPRRRSFVAAVAVQTEKETDESVSAPSRSFRHHTSRFYCHFLPWKSLVTAV